MILQFFQISFPSNLLPTTATSTAILLSIPIPTNFLQISYKLSHFLSNYCPTTAFSSLFSFPLSGEGQKQKDCQTQCQVPKIPPIPQIPLNSLQILSKFSKLAPTCQTT